MPVKTPTALFQHMALLCGGYLPKGAPLKQWHDPCKSNDFICPTELKISSHSKGARCNRETPKPSYAFVNQIDFRDAVYAYNLRKACSKSVRPSFSMISHQYIDLVFKALMRLGFELSSFCLSIKIKGQSIRCQREKGNHGAIDSYSYSPVVLQYAQHLAET